MVKSPGQPCILGPGPLMQAPAVAIASRANPENPSPPPPRHRQGLLVDLWKAGPRQKSKVNKRKRHPPLGSCTNIPQPKVSRVWRPCASLVPFHLPITLILSASPSSALAFLTALTCPPCRSWYSKPNTIVFPVCQSTLPSRHSNPVGDRVAISRTRQSYHKRRILIALIAGEVQRHAFGTLARALIVVDQGTKPPLDGIAGVYYRHRQQHSCLLHNVC